MEEGAGRHGGKGMGVAPHVQNVGILRAETLSRHLAQLVVGLPRLSPVKQAILMEAKIRG